MNNDNPHFRPPHRGNSFSYVLLFALLLTIAYYVFNPGLKPQETQAVEVPISELASEYQKGGLKEVTIESGKVYATTQEAKAIFAIRPEGETLEGLGLSDPKNVTPVRAISNARSVFWASFLSN